MIQRLGARFNDWFRRFMPDPFIFALLLSLLTLVLAVAHLDGPLATRVRDAVTFWRGRSWSSALDHERGFWAFLEFAMQMVLILVTGHALASAPLVRRGIERLARIPRTTGGAAALIAFATMGAALLNWGFSLVFGALLAREVGRSARARGLKIHYPLLGAAAFTGLMIWHGGLSGSGPLDAAGRGVAVRGTTLVIPISETLGAGYNLILSALLLAVVPLLFRLLAPRTEAECVEIAPAPEPPPPERGFRIEESPALTLVFCGLAAFGLVAGFREAGWRFVNLYSVPFAFLFAGMLLHWRPISYVRAVDEAVRGAGGIVLQFPFYAAIYGIMMGSGLHEVFVGGCRGASLGLESSLGIPVARGFPILVFLAACVLNVFIPSGGGQWKIQGPIVCAAAIDMDVPLDRVVMAVAYGDQLTNMIQPFWALALLGITGLKAREIMGYTALVMVIAGPLFILALAVL